MTEPARSWVEPRSRVLAAERSMLFRPSSDKVELERKLSSEERPRFVEEEGLYIGERPRVPRRVKNRLENRILHEYDHGGAGGGEDREGGRRRNRDWFGRDGRLVALPDPTLRPPTRLVSCCVLINGNVHPKILLFQTGELRRWRGRLEQGRS